MSFKRMLLLLLSVVMLFGAIGTACVAFASELSAVVTMEGAAIRTTGVQGLKFVGKLHKNTNVQIAENAEFGILLIPQSVVGKNEQITVETTEVKVVPAYNRMSETEDYIEFNAVLTDIPAEFYGTDILARTYLKNNGTYYYSNQISRSVKSVADLILGADKPTSTDTTVANTVIALYNQVGNDILVNASDIWTSTNNPSTETVLGQYKHVVIIGVDGAGSYFEQASTPNIDRIFENGAKTYKMLTANPTISAQCWGSLLHGVTPEYHGLTNDIAGSTKYPSDSEFPSFFKVIRNNDPDAVLASFCNWNPINNGIIEDDIGVHKVGGLKDEALTAEICSYLSKSAPTAMFVQFDGADSVGHSNGYGTKEHTDQITIIDSYIGQIYQALENKGILDDTLFIVTSDHGGNGKSHGGSTDTEKYVMFAACGKTIEVGGTPKNIEIRDVAAIVLFALGYDCPNTWTARVPSNLFIGVTAKTRPVYVKAS